MNYNNYKNLLQDQLRPPDPHEPPVWTVDGPLKNVKYLGSYFSRRLARKNILTPRRLARLLYVQANRVPGVPGHHARVENNLRRIVSLICQNARSNRCEEGYHIRDVNPRCTWAISAIFALLYGTTPVPHTNYSVASANAISSRVAAHFSRPRRTRGGLVAPSAQCSCRALADCTADAFCSLAGGVGAGAVPNLCVPRATQSQVGSFAGVADFTGQSANIAQPRNYRVGANYVRRNNSFWRRPGPLNEIPW